MPWYDLPLERLREYRTSTQEPDGLDDWWAPAARGGAGTARPARLTPHEPGLYDAVRGVRRRVLRRRRRPRQGLVPAAAGHARRAWSSSSSATAAAGAPRPSTSCCPRSATRCWSWTAGARAAGGRPARRRTATGTGPENSLVMTRGITTPEDYYYTRMFTDAALAVDTARELAGAAPRRGPRRHRGHRRQPGRRAGARRRRAAGGRGGRMPRRRAVPVRHPAGDHARAARAVHRDPGVPREERRAHRAGAEHAAVHRLRAARPPDHRDDAGQRRA